MARNRKAAETNTTDNTRRVTMALLELDSDKIAALQSSGRQRGVYDSELKAFIDSGSSGGQVDLTSGVFKGKKPQTIKTGFEGARKREGAPTEATNVRVIVSDDEVYLLRTDAA